ncbi:alpha/beta hydrolase [Kocuria arenosa]|uniref:alpha/beta hydrolase n=1 Tax=Kocuria arenosa TaxID=3071446 RepID=UPI0034D56CB1
MPDYELTEWGPLVTTLALLVVTAGFAVLWLPDHRGHGWGKYLVQALALVLVTLLTVLTLFLKLNADNRWYSSWADFFAGNAPRPATETVIGAPPGRVSSPAPRAGPTLSDLQRNPRSNPDIGSQIAPASHQGQWVSFDLTGPTTRITQQLLVWLPPSYLDQPDRAYPVLTAFTGYPGTPEAYIHTFDIDRIVRDQVAQGQLREPIVVVPDVYPSGLDSECVDGSAGRYESWVTVDVVEWVRTNLRAADDSQAWATLGYSAGGWCATMLSVRHPDRWPRSINIAGYFSPIYTQDQQWAAPDDPRYTLGSSIAQLRPDVDIWFFSGGGDPIPLQSLASFQPHVRAPTSLTTRITSSGGHRPEVRRPAMAESLTWLGDTSSYFAPGA